jgi:hypothetical protein
VIAADDETDSTELDFVADLIMKLGFESDDMEVINGWLRVPPELDEIAADDVSAGHKALFLSAIDAAAMSDKKLNDAEAAAIDRIRRTLT